MNTSQLLIVATLTVVWASSAAAQEHERRITRRHLPAAVARTVDVESRGGTIRGFSEEKEDGRTFYEMELRINGRTRDVTMDSSGAVIMIEEEVPLGALPQVVQDALRSAAGSGTITLVESITKGGRIVAYEAHVKTNGKGSEIKIAPDGRRLEEIP